MDGTLSILHWCAARIRRAGERAKAERIHRIDCIGIRRIIETKACRRESRTGNILNSLKCRTVIGLGHIRRFQRQLCRGYTVLHHDLVVERVRSGVIVVLHNDIIAACRHLTAEFAHPCTEAAVRIRIGMGLALEIAP